MSRLDDIEKRWCGEWEARGATGDAVTVSTPPDLVWLVAIARAAEDVVRLDDEARGTSDACDHVRVCQSIEDAIGRLSALLSGKRDG